MRIFIILALIFYTNYSFAKNLIIGVENIQYKPQYYMQDGEYSGLARDIFDAFAKYSGHTIIYEPLPVHRLLDFFLLNKVDLKYPDNKNWKAKRKKGYNIKYSNFVAKYTEGVLVLEKNKNLKFLKQINTVNGFTPFSILKQINEGNIKLVENNDFEQAVFMLVYERIKAIYGNIYVAKEISKKYPNNVNIVINKNFPISQDNYYLSSIKHPDVIDEFNTFLENEKDLINSIKSKYNLSNAS